MTSELTRSFISSRCRFLFCYIRGIFIVLSIVPCIYLFALVLIEYLQIDVNLVKILNNETITTNASDSNANPVFILELPVGKAIHDNKRLLNIYNFIWTGEDWTESQEEFDICLATQTSLERLYWLPEVLEKWHGPLSISVHIISKEEWLVLNLFMEYLQNCYPSLMSHVALHVAVPFTMKPSDLKEDLSTLKAEDVWNLKFHGSCGDGDEEDNDEKGAKTYLKLLLETFPVTNEQSLELKEVYPQNHMRNIARKACGTDWTYSTDVDIIPCKNMAESLQEFYMKVTYSQYPCQKCAYVIPTFELDEDQTFPGSKREIASHFARGDARFFHQKLYPPGHNATNYKRWTTTYMEEGPVSISHPSEVRKRQLYEPFYISSDTIPPYDERFLGYGFTRNTQFQEAIFSGWKFYVLTPVFSIHWGLQTKRGLLSTKEKGTGKALRKEQTKHNGLLYKGFKKELDLKKKEDLF